VRLPTGPRVGRSGSDAVERALTTPGKVTVGAALCRENPIRFFGSRLAMSTVSVDLAHPAGHRRARVISTSRSFCASADHDQPHSQRELFFGQAFGRCPVRRRSFMAEWGWSRQRVISPRLAAEVAVSGAILARRFQLLVGQAPTAYLTEWRLSMADELLRAGPRVGRGSRPPGQLRQRVRVKHGVQATVQRVAPRAPTGGSKRLTRIAATQAITPRSICS